MLINVSPVYCKVEHIAKQDARVLDELLSKLTPNYEYSSMYKKHIWDGKHHFYQSGKFPSGLLPMVLTNQDKFVDPIEMVAYSPMNEFRAPAHLTGIEYRDYQIDAIKEILKKQRGLIHIATNGGKSVIIAGAAQSLKTIPILVLTHRIEIKEQLCDILSELCQEPIGEIGAGEWHTERITVGMVTTLYSKLKNSKTAKQQATKQKVLGYLRTIKCVMIDEAHHLTAASWQYVMKHLTEAYYRVGFSGTIKQKNTFDGMMIRSFTGEVLSKVKNKELIDKGISAKPVVNIVMNDCSEKEEKALESFELWFYEKLASEDIDENSKSALKFIYLYGECIIDNKERNNLIRKIVEKEKNKATLIIIDNIAHGDNLEELLTKYNIKCKFIHGESSNRLDVKHSFMNNELPVLIASTIFDEGVDIANIQTLILAAGKKSKRQLLQRIGRGLRRKKDQNIIHIYDFADISHRLMKHSKKRIKTYKKEQFDINYIPLEEL